MISLLLLIISLVTLLVLLKLATLVLWPCINDLLFLFYLFIMLSLFIYLFYSNFNVISSEMFECAESIKDPIPAEEASLIYSSIYVMFLIFLII